MDIVSADALDLAALTALFNAGFSTYLVPLQLSAEAFREHVTVNDIDLSCSRVVVVEDGPVAFALAGRREDEAWIGGMGTSPAHRRRGLGSEATPRSSGCASTGSSSARSPSTAGTGSPRR